MFFLLAKLNYAWHAHLWDLSKLLRIAAKFSFLNWKFFKDSRSFLDISLGTVTQCTIDRNPVTSEISFIAILIEMRTNYFKLIKIEKIPWFINQFPYSILRFRILPDFLGHQYSTFGTHLNQQISFIFIKPPRLASYRIICVAISCTRDIYPKHILHHLNSFWKLNTFTLIKCEFLYYIWCYHRLLEFKNRVEIARIAVMSYDIAHIIAYN